MHELGKFVRTHKTLVLAEWTTRVSGLPSSRPLGLPALRNHIPEFLDRLADALERGEVPPAAFHEVSSDHARERLTQGYDLSQVMTEYRVLREVLFTIYERHWDPVHDSVADLFPRMRVLNRVIDSAIADSVENYTRARDRARDTFVAMLGHDLRTPLQAISLRAYELQAQQGALPAAERAAHVIARCTERMERMITDLLHFARVQLGPGILLAPRAMDLRALIALTVQELASVHPDRTIRTPAYEAAGDLRGTWDQDRLSQLLSNLITNALKHGEDPVVVEPFDRGQYVDLEVRNRGRLGDNAQEYLSASASKGQQDSVGLGLYIVHQIAKAHGGGVTLSEREGEVTVRVSLPRQPSP